MKMLRQFPGQNHGDGLRVVGIDGNGKSAGITIIAINSTVGFPYAIGMTGRMIDVTNKENFRPKVFFQLVLGFDRREVIARRNDAAIQDEEVILAAIEHYVLATGADAVAGERNQNVDCQMSGDASFHELGRNCCLVWGR